MNLIQLGATVTTLLGVLLIGGIVYRGVKRIAIIEMEVTNHIPSQIAKLQDGQTEVKERLIAQEATTAVYFKVVERLIDNGEVHTTL